MQVIDFRAPPSGQHYVIPTYGRPEAWPEGRPFTPCPTLFPTRYAQDSAPVDPSAILIRPRTQETPVRSLGAAGPSQWGANHPMQKNFAQDTIDLAKEQPWLTGLIVGIFGLVALSAFKALGKVES